MQLGFQDYFFLFVILAMLVGSYMLRSRGRKDSQYRASRSKGQKEVESYGMVNRRELQKQARVKTQAEIKIDKEDDDGASKEKSLNVLFEFDGESWDAYEVLGVPAGSSKEQVSEAYQKALEKVEPESKDLVENAYQSIKGTSLNE